MSNEIIDIPNVSHEVTLAHDPVKVLADAKRAASALMEVVKQKKNPVIMNNEQYIEFEDWQMVGKFYGLTAKVVKTEIITIGNVMGYEATAEAIRMSDGMAVSSATSMCLNDEDKWSTRSKYEWVNGKKEKVGDVQVPLFQLRSMAQTRACAKALRNVLAWVVVLAGFKPTVAEEMTGDEAQDAQEKTSSKPPINQPEPKEQPKGDVISEAQRKRLYAIAMGAGMDNVVFAEWLLFNYNYENSRDIVKADYDKICTAAQEYKKNV